MKKEIRQITTMINLRNNDGEENQSDIIEGYALKFDKWSEILGNFIRFKEKLDPHCLDNADMSNVTALFNHDDSMILGRNSVNLSLEVDNIGLKFKLEPTDTSYARDLMENIRQGVVNQCSFAFTLPDNREADDIVESSEEGIDYERTIRQIDKLYDVSIVTSPAYPDTEAVVGARSIEKVKELQRQEKQSEIDLLNIEAEAYS